MVRWEHWSEANPRLLALVLTLTVPLSAVWWSASATDVRSDRAEKNLILNPGNELLENEGKPESWSVIEGNWIQRSSGPDPREGTAYFFAGACPYAELRQEIDLSPWVSEIRRRQVGLLFEGYVSGWKTGKDTGRIIVELFASGAEVPLEVFDSNPISGRLDWHLVRFSLLPPPETDFVRISLVSDRRDGENNDGYFDDRSLTVVAPDTTSKPQSVARRIENETFYSSIPSPSGNLPSRWAYSPKLLQRILEIQRPTSSLRFIHKTEIIPRSLQFPGRPQTGESPAVGRGRGGASYVNWTFGLPNLSDLSVDITFHTEPRPKAKVYIQLYDYRIGKTGQYFGFQYRFGKDGDLRTQFIWSRWSTRDTSNAWVPKRGWIESSGYENDAVGIRYLYRFGAGTYTVHLQMRESDSEGTWYEMRIFDHQHKEWFLIGRMRFPFVDGGLPFLKDGGGSWCEVYGGTETSSDIGEFHLSYGGVYTGGRRIAAKAAKINYDQRIPNSDVSIDPDGRRVHVRFGGQTMRTTLPGRYSLR